MAAVAVAVAVLVVAVTAVKIQGCVLLCVPSRPSDHPTSAGRVLMGGAEEQERGLGERAVLVAPELLSIRLGVTSGGGCDHGGHCGGGCGDGDTSVWVYRASTYTSE